MPPPTLTREQVRAALDQWDPIDILDVMPRPPHDEYVDLIDPVLSLLTRPDPRQNLIVLLEHRMRDDYGLDPSLLGVPAFVDGLLTLSRPR